ncbi:MAG: 30S ribosomal protein S9 [Patescibacteria group bacterium]|jgi:small subunit ribosomal protein S9
MAIKEEKKEVKPKKEVSKEAVVKKEKKEKETIGFSGKYIQALGRRKTAVAQVRLYVEGPAVFTANGKDLEKYFNEAKASTALQPIKAAGLEKTAGASIIVKGGGINAQAEAVRHGFARALLLMDPELQGAMRAKGWLTRDSRKVERKKPGLKKARRAPQWSKR